MGKRKGDDDEGEGDEWERLMSVCTWPRHPNAPLLVLPIPLFVHSRPVSKLLNLIEKG